MDSTQKRIYGYQKQGAKFGHTKIQGKSLLVKGLNVLAGTVSTPLSAPVIGAARLRGGNAASSRGAASLVKEAIGTARACGCTGLIVVRLDSGYYSSAVISAIRSAAARFSVTIPANASVRAAIAAVPDAAWTPIRYPRATWDDQLRAWVSDAEVTETSYTAFTSKNKDLQVTARLIVRRVRDQNKAPAGQGGLFPAWRYHAVLTDPPFELVQAEGQHRDRAVGALAGPLHAKARAATIRRDLIAVAARTARHGRGCLTLHLPEFWHREHEWRSLRDAACGPPAAAA